MDHLCEKTDITLEWEMNGRYLVHSRNRAPTPLTKLTPLDDRGSCNRDSRGHHSTTCDRANERGVCIHPVQSPLTQRTSKQSGREDGAAQQDACLLRRISRISVGVAGSSVTLCAGRGGGDHRISPPSLDVGFSSDELTPCSASKGPLCFPLMDGSRRAATADGRSFPSFVM